MIRIYPSKINGTLQAPASAAHAQRLLFMAAMPAGAPTLVKNIPDCEDTDTAIDCLRTLRCNVEKNEDGSCLVTPFPKNIPAQTAEFDFRRSSTASRLAIAICAAQGIRASCNGAKVLSNRSIFPLTSRMALRGVKFSNFSLPFTMTGRLDPGEFVFEGNEGSQFISALLMALPVLINPSTIKLASPLLDSSFVDLTIDSLADFGVKIEKTDGGYSIAGRQFYMSPDEIETENDWGLAALWVAAGASSGLGHKVVVTGLPANSPQHYRNVTREFPLISQDFLLLDLNAADSPNLTTFYAAISAVRGATVTISGVPQLHNKESDRLKVMAEICRKLGQEAELTDTGIKIIGNDEARFRPDTVIECHDDPWIFMSMVLASTKLTKPVILDDEHCADSIYRNFLSDFKKLGGKYEII